MNTSTATEDDVSKYRDEDFVYLRDGQALVWEFLVERDDVPHDVKVAVNHLMFQRDRSHTTLDAALPHARGWPEP